LSIHDVSEAREKEMELEEKTRTADRMASIGMLGAGLGHDIQNLLLPLRAHLNAARCAADKAGTNGQDAHFDALKRGIEHLQHLADSLHLLACEEPPRHAEARERTSISSWWAQFEPLFRCTVPRRTRLDVKIAAELPEVRVSGHLLTRAVLNLLSNAARAIDARIDQLPNGGRVAVAFTSESDASGDWVRIAVWDIGVGMTPEVRRRATEAFFTTRNGGKGSGLGLSFVARVVEECRGRLEIESEPNIGTTMSMVMPAVERRLCLTARR
jgi:signal transduction histidine kinase